MFILGFRNQNKLEEERHESPIINSQSRRTSLTTDLLILIVLSFLIWAVAPCPAQERKKPFTVADEIELTHFGDPYLGEAEAMHFSPDGNYLVVLTERGRLGLNRVEDSLRFYRSQDIEDFLEHSNEVQPPLPVWIVNRSGSQGSIITKWRWLADSSGVAFLDRMASGNQQLVLADLRKKMVEPLTSAMETVKAFDVRDGHNYVYSAGGPSEREDLQNKLEEERQSPAVVGTGRQLYDLILPEDQHIIRDALRRRGYSWAVVSGQRFEIKDNGVSFVFDEDIALSPDGGSLVTKRPVPDVPSSWEALYPPPYASDPYRIHAGRQDAQHRQEFNLARQYVRMDLRLGSVVSLTDAPTSATAGWWAGGAPSWSSDGRKILLPGTFLKSKTHASSRPCVAVVDLSSDTASCVEPLKGRTETGFEEGYHFVSGGQFVDGDSQRIQVISIDHLDQSRRTAEYRHTADGTWRVVGQIKGESTVNYNGLEVTVKQGLNDPPQLVATRKTTSRIIWDPNPQLMDIELVQAEVHGWKDSGGRTWRAGLFKPSAYKVGQRYPLVIQTHGFVESTFEASGMFPTAFAARALAAAGIVVLQVGEPCRGQTPDEGPCAASAYQAAASQLVSEGIADPDKIGIIGFSRSCFYVMQTLTTGSLHLKAASITSGVLEDYFQYMIYVEPNPNADANLVIGAKPFGEGLQQWLKRSPGFNLDKVTTPLLVVGEGRVSLASMWAPYAGLRYLHKPVELIMLNTQEHILTNPAVRMASQGGSVDWFRFWLQDYEDPDPAKADQYARWRDLRKLQSASGKPDASSK